MEFMDDAQQIAGFRSLLAKQIGNQRYELWFGGQTRLSCSGNVLTIGITSAFIRDWIRQHFIEELKATCTTVFGRQIKLAFEVDGSLLLEPNGNAAPVTGDDGLPLKSSQTSAIRKTTEDTRNPPRPRRSPPRGGAVDDHLSFDSVVVGNGNRFAVSSAQMISQGLHQASPVLFWGPTGVGKTHLLRAVRRSYRQTYAKARAVYLTAEQFTTGFIEALRNSGLANFRQKCRGADLFLLDDIHFLSGKRATVEELFHTLDSLITGGRKVVLASNRPLGELQPLGMELVSRLSAGAVCEIGPPDYAMRRQILRQQCEKISFPLAEELLETIATQVTAGARELQGALNRIQLTSQVQEQVACRAMVDEVLNDLTQQNTRAVRLNDIQKAVCDVFGIEAAGLRSDVKARALTEPRMLAMWLARKYTRAPWREIGQFFGRRSHSTVISAHRRVERLMSQQGTVAVSDKTCRVEDAIRRVELALRTA
jgi:chromosomal replication initiator protein